MYCEQPCRLHLTDNLIFCDTQPQHYGQPQMQYGHYQQQQMPYGMAYGNQMPPEMYYQQQQAQQAATQAAMAQHYAMGPLGGAPAGYPAPPQAKPALGSKLCVVLGVKKCEISCASPL